MFRLASKTRLANNSIQPIVRKYCLTSGNAAKDNKYVFREIPQHFKLMPNSKLSYKPCGGESFLQQVHNPTCDGRIDGTKYKSVLLRAMSIEGNEILKQGVDVKNLMDGINIVHFLVKKQLLHRARMIKNNEIAQEKQSNNEVVFTNVDVIRLDWNYLSSYFVDNKKQTCVLHNPVVLIHENKISNKDILKQAIGSVHFNQPLLIIAEDFDMEMVENLSFDIKVCVLKPNLQDRNYLMEDLEFLTGAKVVNGVTPLNSIPEMLGSCKKVKVSYDVTRNMHPGRHVMHCGLGGEEAFEEDFKERFKRLRSAIESSTLNCEVNVLEDKLQRLCMGDLYFEAVKAYLGKENSKANIGPCHDQRNIWKPQMQSIEAAFREGIITGGGAALLHASKELDNVYATTAVGKSAIRLFQNVLKMPMYTIASSAGFDGSAVVEMLLKLGNPDFGFDPTRGEYIDMIKAGIVDPLKLVTSELDSCVSSFHRYCRMRAAITD